MNNLSTDARNIRRIRIGNLVEGVTEVQLRSLFLAHGHLLSFERPLDVDTGRPGGIAYIEMSAADATTAIVALNGHELGGRGLDVSVTTPLAGWAAVSDRYPLSPRARRTVPPPSARPTTSAREGESNS